MHIEKLLGDIRQQTGAVCCHDFQCGFEHFFDHALPVRLNPTLRFPVRPGSPWHIGTAPLVDGNAKPAGDKPDDLIARQRIAAAGELDEAPLHAVYDHAADRFFVCLRLLLGTLLLHRRLVGFDIFLL